MRGKPHFAVIIFKTLMHEEVKVQNRMALPHPASLSLTSELEVKVGWVSLLYFQGGLEHPESRTGVRWTSAWCYGSHVALLSPSSVVSQTARASMLRVCLKYVGLGRGARVSELDGGGKSSVIKHFRSHSSPFLPLEGGWEPLSGTGGSQGRP